MITSPRRMITCHRPARRIGGYLDDPTVPLDPGESRPLEEHLVVCEKCAGGTADHRVPHRALSGCSRRRQADEAAPARVRGSLDRVTEEAGR